ncbi:hypothetical protein RB595_010104 [Gaeumannomyces hyphopodioides]
MALSAFAWPACWLFLWLFLSFLSLRQREKRPRYVLAVLHIAAVAAGLLGTDAEVLRKLPTLCVHIAVWGTVHTASILFHSPQTTTAGLPFGEQVKATVQTWANIRRLGDHRLSREPPGEPPALHHQFRSLFAMGRISRALVLWLYNRYQVDMLIIRWFKCNNIGVANFLPENQGLLPGLTRADLVLRAIMSVHWMWITQHGLTAAHHVCAAVFVWVLGWDPVEAWTSPRLLFGSFFEAYTLRRFWGVYWHRLHVAPFSAYTPSWLPKRLRALWFFALSAGCHAVVNRALCGEWCVLSELRFFGTNWVVCCLETVLGLDGVDKAAAKPGSADVSLGRRIAGLGFVWGFFFCTVPAWQYPIVLAGV